MNDAAAKTLNPVGWGYLDDALSDAERQSVLTVAGAWFGGKSLERRVAPSPGAVALPASRIAIPSALAEFVGATHDARLLHARGRSFRDLATLRGDRLDAVPDAVATPRN